MKILTIIQKLREGTRIPFRDRRGASLLELALVMPLVLLLVLGTIDFGRFAYSYIALHNAAREGAFYAATHPGSFNRNGQDPAWTAAITERIQDELSPLGDYEDNKDLLVIQPITLTGELDDIGNPRAAQYYVEITVEYPFNMIVDWTFLADYFSGNSDNLPGQTTMSATTRMRAIR